MTRKSLQSVILAGMLTATGSWAADAKPDLTGTWLLDQKKSKFDYGGMGGGPMGGMGGPGMGGPGSPVGPPGGGTGGPGMGGTGVPMGPPGDGMAGPGMGGGPMGGGGMAGRRFGSMVIEHQDPHIVITGKMPVQGQEREIRMEFTADGKKIEQEGPNGMKLEIKTKWDKLKLVTSTVIASPMGLMEFKEIRSLSNDGKVLTVERQNSFGGVAKLIYNRQE